ncbi:MAG: phosphoribosylformylglycinamidine synthase [Lachnospiraceae bacterium]|jgi:phosphoribosylformylglycinamidine synthase|nr:phosphoribosylformylglycinamidine synthase [Lachnospiraceae bacterium]
MAAVKRIYVERSITEKIGESPTSPFHRNNPYLHDIRHFLGITAVESVRVLTRYDFQNISDDLLNLACQKVFTNPELDTVTVDMLSPSANSRLLCVEYLPGQFDQRAALAEQTIKLLDPDAEPTVKTAVVYIITGVISDKEFATIKSYFINNVDSHEAKSEFDKGVNLVSVDDESTIPPIAVYEGFVSFDGKELLRLFESLSLAMTYADFLHIHEYFQNEEKRDPTVTEIRVLDTYWSDHCRHTTFLTELSEVEFENGFYRAPIEMTYRRYMDARSSLLAGRDDKYVCLMDLAQIAMREQKAAGTLTDMEDSEEINACSLVVPIEIETDTGNITEEWLVMFKNETHNHPTEIEPYGGAATCLGGGIRDPLSGRGFVHQAMRVSGSADPGVPFAKTMPGKLPQRKLSREAAAGHASYANQIGVPAGQAKEIYHPGYLAKRMELGALVAAAPRKAVKRSGAEPEDVIILVGGRTGRDGCGGATGSSKVHDESSLTVCGAEVQKGDPPTERAIIRLFRREEASLLIKKCNDFGAGGVAVAIGELAAGINVDLDKVPVKYSGLDGTELAISESQERMAVVIAPADVAAFMEYAAEENVEATIVGLVTAVKRLVLTWRGERVVDLARSFLDTNGVRPRATVKVKMPRDVTGEKDSYFRRFALDGITDALANNEVKKAWLLTLGDLNVCSQKGMVEKFDTTIGGGTVVLPLSGKYQLSESQAMVARLPLLDGKTKTVTMMSQGNDPYLAAWSPYHGAAYAVLESLAKIVAGGGDYRKARLSFQEYFARLGKCPERWGQPFAALLGAYNAQRGFTIPSIGGKDSMSGSFLEHDVPPTLVSFAVSTANIDDIITPEFKSAANKLVHFAISRDRYGMPQYEQTKSLYDEIGQLIKEKKIVSAYALDSKGVAAALSKMAFGSKLGCKLADELLPSQLFEYSTGDIIVEMTPSSHEEMKDIAAASGQSQFRQRAISEKQESLLYPSRARTIGTIITEPSFVGSDFSLTIAEALTAWEAPLEEVFPTAGASAVELSSVIGASAASKKDGVDSSGSLTDRVSQPSPPASTPLSTSRAKSSSSPSPTVFIPVLTGTNGEYDVARAFQSAGAKVITKVFKTHTAADIRASTALFAASLAEAQILVLPGGINTTADAYSGIHGAGSSEPLGSAAFYTAVFCQGSLHEALARHHEKSDGLILGINQGFHALLRLGFFPGVSLCQNTIARHISRMGYTKVKSNSSPWLNDVAVGEVLAAPASLSFGRLVASHERITQLFANGQIATCYSDPDGNVHADGEWNIGGSIAAIEGITSTDGRCFGKLLHSERNHSGGALGVYGQQDTRIFTAAVRYFS